MKARIGVVSEGTMRPEDLIPAFADELRELDTEGEYADLLMEAATLMDSWGEEEEEEDGGKASDILGELFDALDSFSPAYCSFGARFVVGWLPTCAGSTSSCRL